ncbi:MAG TPA: amidase family protein, partial [Stellaceae bacterium]|nr:amidase family protein [Stellaceae bacterium]
PAVERDHVDAEVLAAYDLAVETLEKLGAEIVTVDLPRRFADYTQLTGRIIGAESYFLVGDLIDDPSLPIDEAVRPRIATGRGVSARDYLAALREQAEAKEEFAAALGDADALLTPTTTTAAIPLDAVDQATTPAHFTRFVNALEICALAVPDGFTGTGLPLSLQIVCRAYDEATALRIGLAYQRATKWHERRPPAIAG